MLLPHMFGGDGPARFSRWLRAKIVTGQRGSSALGFWDRGCPSERYRHSVSNEDVLMDDAVTTCPSEESLDFLADLASFGRIRSLHHPRQWVCFRDSTASRVRAVARPERSEGSSIAAMWWVCSRDFEVGRYCHSRSFAESQEHCSPCSQWVCFCTFAIRDSGKP
jgi:hypothetical protein